MVRTGIIFLALSLVVGCLSKPYSHQYAKPSLNTVNFAAVGDEFFRHEDIHGERNRAGMLVEGEARMVKMTVVGLKEDVIELRCQEFTKPLVDGGYRIEDNWVLKDEFTQRYDYKGGIKEIRIKNYGFEITGIESGRIRYSRLL
jgi:hypothetical protein